MKLDGVGSTNYIYERFPYQTRDSVDFLFAAVRPDVQFQAFLEFPGQFMVACDGWERVEQHYADLINYFLKWYRNVLNERPAPPTALHAVKRYQWKLRDENEKWQTVIDTTPFGPMPHNSRVHEILT